MSLRRPVAILSPLGFCTITVASAAYGMAYLVQDTSDTSRWLQAVPVTVTLSAGANGDTVAEPSRIDFIVPELNDGSVLHQARVPTALVAELAVPDGFLVQVTTDGSTGKVKVSSYAVQPREDVGASGVENSDVSIPAGRTMLKETNYD